MIVDFHGLFPTQAIGQLDRLIAKYSKVKKLSKVVLIVGHGAIRGIVSQYLTRLDIPHYYDSNNTGVITVYFNQQEE